MARIKKLYTFFPENEQLISRILFDVIEEYSLNESSSVEKILLRYFYGDSKMAKFYINSLYDNGINTTLSKIYSNNSAGINGNCINSDFLDFLEFSVGYISENNLDFEINKNDSYWNYFSNKFNSLIQNSNISGYDLDSFMFVSDIFQFILNKWNEIKEFDLTYRLLMACHKLIETHTSMITDTPFQRLRLREIILDNLNESKSLLHII